MRLRSFGQRMFAARTFHPVWGTIEAAAVVVVPTQVYHRTGSRQSWASYGREEKRIVHVRMPRDRQELPAAQRAQGRAGAAPGVSVVRTSSAAVDATTLGRKRAVLDSSVPVVDEALLLAVFDEFF